MTINTTYLLPVFLQLLADGGGDAGGDTGSAEGQGVTEAAALPQRKGAKSNPLAVVQYGIQEESVQAAAATETAQPDRNAEFDKLIKGEYKDLYDANVQNIVQQRLKGSKETVAKFEKLSPILETLYNKYGVQSDDIEGLAKAIDDDDSFYEDEAMQRGMSVQQLKDMRKMERENANLKRQMHEQETQENASRLYRAWMEQAESAKAVYPNFDLRVEMDNPRFVDLLRSNIDVRTAYEVVHKDEIMRGAMQFTAKKVEQQLANKIAAGASRPAENGTNSQAPSLVKSDVSQLSKADRQEIARRVARGEKIRF